MGKVTIQSMAKELGLSRNTVAMALKDDPKVAPVTRERVLRMGKEMAIWAKMYMWKKFGHRRRSITILWFCVRGMPLFIGTVS